MRTALMTRRTILLAGLAGGGGAAVVRAADLPALTPEKVARVEKLVQSEMSRLSVPGVTVSITVGKEARWTKGFGFADLENDIPATPQTMYRLASISKMITAIAVMQLAEKGKLDLDAPIQQYVPSFPVKPKPVTARLLLTHQGGIRHYQRAEMESTRFYPGVTESLAIFAADPLVYEPGTRHFYTTYGFVLLGAAVEGASGVTYPEYLRRNVFDAAKLDRIRTDSVYALIPHRTRGYLRNASGELLNCGLADTSNKVPGGGLISTAGDLTQMAQALMDHKLMKRATLEQMWVDQKTADNRATGYGLGFMLGDVDGQLRVAHTGHQQGTSTVLSLVPGAKVAVAILGNLEGVEWLPLATRIQQVVLAND